MNIDLHSADDIGARSEQQDASGSAILNDAASGRLLVLADGVGGHAAGATASGLTVDTVLDAAASGTFDDPAQRRDALHAVIKQANDGVRKAIESDGKLKGMASTLVVAILSDDGLRWASVGDSHLYLLRGGQLRKLNEDHSYVGLLIKSGKNKPDDPELDEYRNLIASAISGDEVKYIDVPDQPFPLESGDIIALATDGLDTLPTNHIEALLYEKRDSSAEEIAAALLNGVRRAGKANQDNTTVVVGRVAGAAATSAAAEAPVRDDPPTTRRRAQPYEGPGPDAGEVRQAETAAPAPATQRGPFSAIGARWPIAALILLAALAGGAYWVLSSYIDSPGQGVFSTDSGTRDGPASPAITQATKERHDCITRLNRSRHQGQRFVRLPAYCAKYLQDADERVIPWSPFGHPGPGRP